MTVPHSARIWNYWLGGKDNYPVDREAGDAWMATDPSIVDIARAARAYLIRVVAYLAGPAGVHQFIDVGTGLPTTSNTHEVAQSIAPDARVIYVDNDPMVLAHARALLVGTPGTTSYVEADMTDTATIIKQAAELLDFDQPIALMFMGILGHLPDLNTARAVVRELLDPLPPGSYLALYDDTLPLDPAARDRMQQAQQTYAETGAVPYWSRPSGDIASLFGGLNLVDPGFVRIPLWRPGTVPGENRLRTLHAFPSGQTHVAAYGGVARKT